MSAREFVEWQIFYAYDPWDEARADRRAALQAHVFYQLMRGKGSGAISIEQFAHMIQSPWTPSTTGADELAGQRILAAARAYNQRVRRERQHGNAR